MRGGGACWWQPPPFFDFSSDGTPIQELQALSQWEGRVRSSEAGAHVKEQYHEGEGPAFFSVSAHRSFTDDEQDDLSVSLIVPKSRFSVDAGGGEELWWGLCQFSPKSPPWGTWATSAMDEYRASTAVCTAWDRVDPPNQDIAVFLLSERPRERFGERLDSLFVRKAPLVGGRVSDFGDREKVALADALNSTERLFNAMTSNDHQAISIHMFPPDEPPSPWGGVRGHESEGAECSMIFPIIHCYFFIRPLTERAGWDWGSQPPSDMWRWFERTVE